MNGPPNDLIAALPKRIGRILNRLGVAGFPEAESRRILDQILSDAPPPADPRYVGPNLSDLLRLFAAIRLNVLEELPDAMGRPISAEESLWLNKRLDAVLEQAADNLARRSSHDICGGLNAILLTAEVLGHGVQRAIPDSMEDVQQIKKSVAETLAAVERWLRKSKPPA